MIRFTPSLTRSDTRPIITREQVLSLSQQVLAMSEATDAKVFISHVVKHVTRLASNRVRDTDVGDSLSVSIEASFGDGNGNVMVSTNQLDSQSLRDMVARADAISKDIPGSNEMIHVHSADEQDAYPVTRLYHQSSVDAMRTGCESSIPVIMDMVKQTQLHASGFVGLMARADAYMTNQGIVAFSEETDCEVNVTVRSADGKSTGWSGAVSRDWTHIDSAKVAQEAIEISKLNVNVQALEPGRRTAILAPSAVAQLLRFMVGQFDGYASDEGRRGFSKLPGQARGSRFNERLFDQRIRITSDPVDPEGGFKPWFGDGYVNNPTTWVEHGMLKYLGYGMRALAHGKKYADLPHGLRLDGGETTLPQMIAQCDEGIYVNRISDVELIDWRTGMMSGVTRDGCFLVRHGTIDRAVKNFRFLTSPFFFLNNLLAIGPTQRVAFGYSPWTDRERESGTPSEGTDWPRRPMIVPPLMVRDFNFNALIDAV
jgi:predicted Zn-dependent protease